MNALGARLPAFASDNSLHGPVQRPAAGMAQTKRQHFAGGATIGMGSAGQALEKLKRTAGLVAGYEVKVRTTYACNET